MLERVMIFAVIFDQNGPNWGPFGIHPMARNLSQIKTESCAFSLKIKVMLLVLLVMLVQLALLVLPHVLRYAEVCWDMLGYARICWDMLDRLGYVRICWDMLGFAGIC